jgi:DNA-binding IclR family transcriptional regulator
MITIQTIGETAGEIWRYLKEHDEATLSTLVRAIGEPGETVHMAVGWLAREGKLELSQEKRTITVRLVGK